MNEVFNKAKNGDTLCCVNGINLHSQYNPQKEAERFVDSIEETVQNPAFIVVTGAALSYCVPFLRKRFPQSKLCAVQYSQAFSKTDSLWDYAIDVSTKPLLCNELYSIIGEESASATLFLSWPPSENAYKSEYTHAWSEIKKFVTMARDILGTRMYFNKRWLKNTVTFFSCADSVCLPCIDKSLPIVIAASGPSLKPFLSTLKEARRSFYLIAASSAITPLLKGGIIPDACISTDGGFWAQSHVKELRRNKNAKNVPIFASAESSLPRTMLKTHPLIPLSYGDAIERLLFEYSGIPFINAKRNGTVSGTIAELALTLSTNDVYALGLDLCSCTGFQHTQPNELELDSSIKDFRLSPLETRNAVSGFENGSLTVYRSWFSSRPKSFYTRFFRVYNEENPYKTTLGGIKDITARDFAARLLQSECRTQPNPCCKTVAVSQSESCFPIATVSQSATCSQNTAVSQSESNSQTASFSQNAPPTTKKVRHTQTEPLSQPTRHISAADPEPFYRSIPIPPLSKRRKIITEYIQSVKIKLTDYQKKERAVSEYDEESTLWLKTIDLGSFIGAERLKTALPNDKMNGVIAFIDTLIQTVSRHE